MFDAPNIVKFTKKPIQIEAIQHGGMMTSWYQATEFIGADLVFPYMMNPGSNTIHIKNKDGSLTPWKEGDYLVKDSGHVYVVPKDLFELTYQKDEQ